MKILLKVLIPVLIFIAFVYGAKLVRDSAPEPFRRPSRPVVQSVEATTLSTSEYEVKIASQGNIQPTIATSLVPEVLGSISMLSDSFVVGGSFKKGDILVQIDQRDYQIALTQARANLAQADAQLQQEQAQAQLASEEWESLRRGQKPSNLTLRKPQLAAARANLNAARASVTRAELDLSRTQIVAPYDGMVIEKQVDLGQFVNRGVEIGRIYSTESVDVRLPLSSRQLSFLTIPSTGLPVAEADRPAVELRATVGSEEHIWNGWLERVEGVDSGTQQLNVIARIENPMTNSDIPLRIGQYVNASIVGRKIKDVFVIPRLALRENDEVLILDADNKLLRQSVSVVWADEAVAVIDGGLSVGTILVTTPLSTVTDGTPVRPTIDGVAPPPPNRQGQGGGRPGANRPPGGEGGSGENRARGQGGQGNAQGGQRRGQGGDAGAGQRGGQDGEAGTNADQRGDGTRRRGDSQGGEGDANQRRRQGQGGEDQGNQRRRQQSDVES
ncbi:MAG: efflux RND transporter periplasmic adaptor subunit [Gammaproteobacteria bacterium]|nr:efflux RND transporter periplasmic adaptor subunit [Gammaproteobacteria bacterium]